MASVAQTWPVYTGTELNHRDRVLGEVEKNSFIGLPAKGGQQQDSALKTVSPLPPTPATWVVSRLDSVQGAGRGQLMGILLIGWW